MMKKRKCYDKPKTILKTILLTLFELFILISVFSKDYNSINYVKKNSNKNNIISNCGTYVINDDNENNSLSGFPDYDWWYCVFNDDPVHPIEFEMPMTGSLPTSDAKLLLLCWDIDDKSGEVDEIYFNGHLIGYLTGADSQNSTTILDIPDLAWVNLGNNLVQIYVDVNNIGNPTWCVEIMQAQLLIDGGCGGTATCRYITTDYGSYNFGDLVTTTTEVDTSVASQYVTVETDIYGSNNKIIVGTSQSYTTYGNVDDPISQYLWLPFSGTPGVYRVESLVFDGLTGEFQSSCITYISCCISPPLNPPPCTLQDDPNLCLTGIQVDWQADPGDWNDGGTGTRGYEILRNGGAIVSGGCSGLFPYGTTNCLDNTTVANQGYEYYVQYINGLGCGALSPASFIVDTGFVTPVITGATPSCVPLSLSTGSYSSYQWYRNGSIIWGAVSQNYLAVAPGNYTVRVTDGNGCSGTSAPFTVHSSPKPVVSGPASGCGSVTLSTGNYSLYQWGLNGNPISGETSQSINAIYSGTYSVTATDIYGCTGTSAGYSVAVYQNPKPVIGAGDIKDRFWAADGAVKAITESNGIVYIGGDFTFVGPYSGSGVVLDKTTGLLDTTFPKINGMVHAAIPDGNGGWFIGGDFTKIEGIDRIRIAHILPGNMVDLNFNPGAFESVRALALDGNTLYAGGNFGYLAVLDAATGALKNTFNLSFAVYCLTISGSTLYVGGSFNNFGGQARYNMAGIDLLSGLVNGWNPGSDGPVYAISVSGSSAFVGGWFNTIGGLPRNYIASVDSGTGIPASWTCNADSPVFTISISGTTVYAGGWFTNIGGQSRQYIAAIDSTTGQVLDWNPSPDGIVNSIAASGSAIYVGGDFQIIGSSLRNRIAGINSLSGKAEDWDPDSNSSVHIISLAGNSVFAGGDLTGFKWINRDRIAAFDENTGEATPWNPDIGATVNALAVSGNTLYAGGLFYNVGGSARHFIAGIDTLTGLATPWNPDSDGEIYSILVSGSTVYTGGAFSTIGSASRNNIAAIDAGTGLAEAWNPGADGYVRCLAESGSTIYIGGDFYNAGGVWRPHAAGIDMTTGQATGWDPEPDGSLFALHAETNLIYGGGNFYYVNGQVRQNICAMDPADGTPASWSPNANSPVRALDTSGNNVYAGGDFNSIGAQSRNYIAAMDMSTGNALSWNPGADGLVQAIAISGSTFFAGGSFTMIGGENRGYFAAISSGLTETCGAGAVELKSTAALSYQWIKDGIDIAGATARIYNAAENGTYAVRVTYTGGCSDTSDPIILSFTNPPVPVVNGNSTGCATPGVVLSTGIYAAYQWRNNGIGIPGASSQTYTAVESGNYSVWVMDSSGCEGISADFPVTVSQGPAPNIFGNSSGCADPGVLLSTETYNGYQWYKDSIPIGGAVSQNYTAVQSGDYGVAVTDSSGCIGISSLHPVTIFANPAPSVYGDNWNTCPSTTVQLSTGLFSSYQWYHDGSLIAGADTQSLNANVSGTYWAVVVDANGCMGISDYHTVFIDFCPNSEVSPIGALFPHRVVKSASSTTGFYFYFQRLDSVDGYNIYEGGIGNFYDHGLSAGNECDAAVIDLGTGEMRAEILPSAGDHYYLVTAYGGGSEGPSGYSSTGTEIDPAQSTCLP